MNAQLIKAVVRPVIKESTKATLKNVGILAAFFGGCTMVSTVNYAMINGVKTAMNDAHEKRQEKRRKAKEEKEQKNGLAILMKN